MTTEPDGSATYCDLCDVLCQQGDTDLHPYLVLPVPDCFYFASEFILCRPCQRDIGPKFREVITEWLGGLAQIVERYKIPRGYHIRPGRNQAPLT
jgi:hypothetical protein